MSINQLGDFWSVPFFILKEKRYINTHEVAFSVVPSIDSKTVYIALKFGSFATINSVQTNINQYILCIYFVTVPFLDS